jgi:hypothetical protein
MGRPWRDRLEHPLTAGTLQALFDNRIACIRVAGFATPAESRAFVAAMDEVGLAHEYKTTGPNIRYRSRYLGSPQFEFRRKTKADYFATVGRAAAERAAVFARAGFDPIRRLIGLLERAAPGKKVAIAEEPGFGPYYAGIIRETTGGANLHFDFARLTAPGYAIAANDAQIATNFYASGTEEGGETTLYNLHYDPGVPAGTYVEISPFDAAHVEGCESTAFRPAAGDLVMFNSRCPHRVSWNPRDDGQRRLGIGCFVGRAPGGDLVLWS